MTIFVFGSNLAGRHGRGAARCANKDYGAVFGVGVGRTGSAYAIPTKTETFGIIPLNQIESYVIDFLIYAADNPNLDFYVTKIGCGLAGYNEVEIKPFFQGAPVNCQLPEGWRDNDEEN